MERTVKFKYKLKEPIRYNSTIEGRVGDYNTLNEIAVYEPTIGQLLSVEKDIKGILQEYKVWEVVNQSLPNALSEDNDLHLLKKMTTEFQQIMSVIETMKPSNVLKSLNTTVISVFTAEYTSFGATSTSLYDVGNKCYLNTIDIMQLTQKDGEALIKEIIDSFFLSE